MSFSYTVAAVRRSALVVALLLAPSGRGLWAQTAPPSPEDVLGYALGERFTDVAGVNRYMQALAQASPRVTVQAYGETVEHRPLIQVVVASEEHRGRLDRILAENAELVDPATPEGRAAEIIARNPAVVYFSYGIHGNESSSSEAAMWTAWDLARGAEEVRGVLDSVVVVLDPVVNPDGRDRYVSWYRQVRETEPNPRPETREHQEPWPGGRYNHYMFDLNRDWAWMSQPETGARLATWDRWNPQVHVDFHEMSYRSTYFFFPATDPINPIYPRHVLEWARRFGEGNARAFDREGWLYYTTEGFDLFYPGYGDSWPALGGTVGMTYEQAGGGTAGLAVERPDGTVLTLRDRAMHHRTSGEATLRTAAEGKTELLSGFAAFHRDVASGLPNILLVPGANGAFEALLSLLRRQGIRLERASSAFRADASVHRGYEPRERFPEGTVLVRARQPRGKLAVTLLRPEVTLDASFSYDITGWSLPYAFGVEAYSVEGVPDAGWSPLEAPGGEEADDARGAGPYGALVPPGFQGAPALVDFLEAGGRAYVIQDTFSLAGRAYPRGTTFLPRGRNPELDRLLESSGLTHFSVPVATGLTDGGADLGTEESAALRLPRIGLLAGRGTSPSSYGAHWFFLERRLGAPFDAIDVAAVERTDLDPYDVIVVPSGRVRSVLGESGTGKLESWIRDGGVLVAVDESARDLAEPLGGIEEREAEDEDVQDRDARLERALRSRQEREEERWRESVPGTILRVRLDPRHPLAFGAAAPGGDDRMFVLTGGESFEPDESFESVAYFDADPEKISGVISEGSLERMDRSTWLAQERLGQGKLILFADDPLFRLFWYSGFQPYVNALLLGPAF